MANETKRTPTEEPAKGSNPNELSDDQLDKVAGGGMCDNIANVVQTFKNQMAQTVSQLATETTKSHSK